MSTLIKEMFIKDLEAKDNYISFALLDSLGCNIEESLIAKYVEIFGDFYCIIEVNVNKCACKLERISNQKSPKRITTIPVKPRIILASLTNYARTYTKTGVESVIRNRHMNELESADLINQKQIEAVIVDFINYIGAHCGVDYALNTSDLKLQMEEIYED